MNTSFKIFMATALGAGIGTVIALNMPSFMWWLGAIIGGLIGYLSFEYEKVLIAFKTAYKSVTEYEPDSKVILSALRDTFMVICSIISAVIIVVLLLFNILTITAVFVSLISLTSPLFNITPLTSTLISISIIIYGIGATRLFMAIENTKPGDAVSNSFTKIIFFLSPIAVIFYWLPLGIKDSALWTVRIVIFSPKTIPRIFHSLSIVPKVIWKAFTLIHSDIRLLCGVDAMIGAGAGYFFVNPLIGMLIGGILGVANYEIVSKRWLKLMPTTK